jgi:Leucine-rich repeat (LRR) protein
MINSHPTRSSNLRFLRLLLAAGLIFGIGSGLGAYRKRALQVREQRNFISHVADLGGFTYYDYQLRLTELGATLADDDGIQSHPNWMAQWIGKDWLHDIFYVSFAQFSSTNESGSIAKQHEKVGDELLDQAAQISSLRWLALTGTNISDQGIARLSTSPLQLERLWLSQTPITDAALSHLSNCPSLTHLAVEGTATSDIGLQRLTQLPNLQSLSLGSPYFTSSGLQAVGKLVTLRELYLDRLPVDDQVLTAARSLTQLAVLSLRSTAVTDLGLRQLSQLTQLRELNLDGTQVDGTAFEAGISPASLEVLSLHGTQLSDEHLESLADYRRLKKLGVRGTNCSLAGLIELLVEKQGRSLDAALALVATTTLDAAGHILTLDLSGLNVVDADVQMLCQLTHLQWLTLPGRLTDFGATQLAQNPPPNLSLLNVNHSQITDRGLEELAKIESLKNLHVASTNVTQAGVDAARATLHVYNVDLRAAQNFHRKTSQ